MQLLGGAHLGRVRVCVRCGRHDSSPQKDFTMVDVALASRGEQRTVGRKSDGVYLPVMAL